MEDKEKEPCGNRVQMAGKKQITLRLPDELYEALREEASQKGIAINEEMIFRLSPITDSEFYHSLFHSLQCKIQ